MTLTIAWERKLNETTELVIVSDSRLRSGMAWDTCPKLLTTARGDICFGFAGDTMYAYPFLLQAIHHISLHRASRIRDLDLYEVKGHIERLFEGMLVNRSDFPKGQGTPDLPETQIVLAGYSWKRKEFVLFEWYWDQSLSKFAWKKSRGLRIEGVSNHIAILGDPAMTDADRTRLGKEHAQYLPGEKDVKKIAAKRIATLVKQRQSKPEYHGLNMEPFEVLCEIITEKVSPHVAGPPQMIKMYQSCSSQVVGVLWNFEERQAIAVNGRPLLPYERLECPVIDPNTLECGFDLWQRGMTSGDE